MAFDKTKSYMILNYDTSPIAVSTRTGSVLIPAGSDNIPSGIPFSFDDILYINMTTSAFKTGQLWFEPEFENEMYKELRILNSDDIMTNQEIEDIIINPTVEKLERLLAIDDANYFNRCYGVYIGLRNEGVSMSGKIQDIMASRREEFRRNRRKTGIKIRHVDDASDAGKNEVNDLKRQLAEMQKQMEKLMAANLVENTSAQEKPAPKKPQTKKKQTTKEEAVVSE